MTDNNICKGKDNNKEKKQNQLPLSNFYQPLTPLIEESNIAERPIVPGNTSYTGALREGEQV